MDRRAINGLNFIFSAGQIQRLTGQERRVALVSRELTTLPPERVYIMHPPCFLFLKMVYSVIFLLTVE